MRRLCLCISVCLPLMVLAADAADRIRKPAFVGTLYPADPTELSAIVDGYLGAPPAPVGSTSPIHALILPSQSYTDCGAILGLAYSRIPADITRVIILTPWHPTYDHLPQDREAMRGKGAIPDKDAYATPLGNVTVDPECKRLRDLHPCFADVDVAHFWEPGVEIQLPFVLRRLGNAIRVIPIVLDRKTPIADVADALAPLLDDDHTLIVASTDLSVAQPGKSTPSAKDRIEAILAGDADQVAACDLVGDVPIRIMLALAARNCWKARRLGPADDADPESTADQGEAQVPAIAFSDDPNRVSLLHIAADADWDDPATKAAFADAARASNRVNFRGDLLSAPEQALLLALARKTIQAKLSGVEPPAPPLYSDTFSSPQGCFVTLNKHGKLRGCIGTILPKHPLATAVQANALAAALGDKRFEPVTPEELPEIEIEISVLTPLRKIDYQDGADLLSKLRQGVDGVLVTYNREKQSTYLPQVWQQIPDKLQFMANLCSKGGIPPDAWKDPSQTVVQVYEVFAFAENQ